MGYNPTTEAIIEALEKTESTNLEIVGNFVLDNIDRNASKLPVLGNVDELPNLAEVYQINEIIFTDERISKIEILDLLQKVETKRIKIYYAQGYEDVLASDLISSLMKDKNLLDDYRLLKFRFRFFKRVFDLTLLMLLITIGIPFLFLFFEKEKRKVGNLVGILIGKMTFVGLDKEYMHIYSKKPLITISEASSNFAITPRMKEKLNNFYLQNYSPLLDLEILFKYKRGRDGKNTTKVSS